MCLAHYWAILRSDSDFSGRSLFAKRERGKKRRRLPRFSSRSSSLSGTRVAPSLNFPLFLASPLLCCAAQPLFSSRPDHAHLFCARFHRCFGRHPALEPSLGFWFFDFPMESSEFSLEERRRSPRQEFQREVDSAANGTCFVRRVEERGIPLILPRRENLKDLHLWNKFHATRIYYDFS